MPLLLLLQDRYTAEREGKNRRVSMFKSERHNCMQIDHLELSSLIRTVAKYGREKRCWMDGQNPFLVSPYFALE